MLCSSFFLKHPKKNILHLGIKAALASNPSCPSCGSTDVDANRLIPNKSLRNSIQKYKDEHGDPDEQPLEPPPTQEPVSTTNEEPTIPVDTGNTEKKLSNGNQAPSEVPQVSSIDVYCNGKITLSKGSPLYTPVPAETKYSTCTTVSDIWHAYSSFPV
jgi:hypothetical protein